MNELLFYGASNTYGWDPRSFLGGRYPADNRWPERVGEALGLPAVNLGEPGRCFPAHPAEFTLLGRYLDTYPDAALLVISLGTNELLSSPAPDAEVPCARLASLLTWLREKRPSLPLLVLAPPPVSVGTEADAASRLLYERYSGICAPLGIPCADAGSCSPEQTFDGVHLSEAGNRALAAWLADVLRVQKLLRNRKN